MKKSIAVFVFAFGINAYSQQKMFSDNLGIATAENKIQSIDFKSLTSHLSYFSKNYEKVFGEYIFSNDSNNFGARNVYVGYDNRMHYQGSSIFIMENQGALTSGNLAWNADYVSGLLSGIKLIFNREKNYTKSYSSFK